MPKKVRKNKGTIVCDECVGQDLIKAIQQTGWKAIKMKKADRGLKVSDQAFSRAYVKGRYPLLTNDFKAYSENQSVAEKPTGYVEQESYSKMEKARYTRKVSDFFTKTTASNVKGKRWRIPIKGDPYCTTLPKEK